MAEDLPSVIQRSRAAGEEIYPSFERKETELRKSISIVVQDNRSVLLDAPEKTADALGRSYRFLQKVSNLDLGETLQPYEEEEDSVTEGESIASVCGGSIRDAVSVDYIREAGHKAQPPPLPSRAFSFDTTLRQRGQIHLQSADLFENFSPVQKERQYWKPTLPDVFSMGFVEMVDVDSPELIQHDGEALKALHPNSFGRPCLEIMPTNGNIHACRTAVTFVRVEHP